MKAYTISNGFRQGREAAFGALLMELCIGGERIASFLGIRTWYESVGTFRIILCILIFVYFYIQPAARADIAEISVILLPRHKKYGYN